MPEIATPARSHARWQLQSIFRDTIKDIPAGHIRRARLADPKGMSPLIYVTSAGSNRERITGRVMNSSYTIEVFVLVLLVDEHNSAWTEESAEDMLDRLEAQIADVLVAYKSVPGVWSNIEYSAGTSVERIPLGGNDYIVELISLNVVTSS